MEPHSQYLKNTAEGAVWRQLRSGRLSGVVLFWLTPEGCLGVQTASTGRAFWAGEWIMQTSDS